MVNDAHDLERLADVPLHIVCFRFNLGSSSAVDLNELNERSGEALLKDGRFHADTVTVDGRVALRPEIVDWRTRTEGIDLFVAGVRELRANVAGK